jgi:hypothetical protein
MKSNHATGFLVAAGLVIATSLCQATLTTYTDRTAWETAVGGFHDVVLETQVGDGAILQAGNLIDIGLGGSLAFGQDMLGRQVPNTWGTWSGGNTPRVLYFDPVKTVSRSLAGTFTPGVRAFGFEAEPASYDEFSITLELSDNSRISQNVYGYGGASFFGWNSDDVWITSMTITTADTGGFAIGRMVHQGMPVPDGGRTLFLALLALGSVRLLASYVRVPAAR